MSSRCSSGDDSLSAKLRASAAGLASTTVLVAVSGGPDSVALLLGLGGLRDELDMEVYAAHVHHGWRGAEADADAEFVLALGNALRIPTEVLPVTADDHSRLAGKSLEEGARDIRYELLVEAATRRHCDAVAVGHTADDQVETVLHHIVRGTGVSGLAGMPAERRLAGSIRLIRPLLHATRGEILRYLKDRQQPYRTDATNADATLTRNRLRLHLLPLLRNEFNPRVDAALLRLAHQAGETAQVLESLAQQLLDQALLSESDTEYRLDASLLAQQSEAVIRQTLRRLWIRRQWPRQEMGQREWERLTGLVFEPGAMDLPGGVSARRESGPLILSRSR